MNEQMSGSLVESLISTVENAEKNQEKVTLQCNECGKKRKVSAEGTYNDRCQKCGGVDWDVL